MDEAAKMKKRFVLWLNESELEIRKRNYQESKRIVKRLVYKKKN